MNEREYDMQETVVNSLWTRVSGAGTVMLDAFSREYVKGALRDAFKKGLTAQIPPFPPDRERIAQLEDQLEVAKDLLDQKDEQIVQMKGQMGDAEALKAARVEITRIRSNKNLEIDRLMGLLERQRVRIVALESDPSTAEGRWNIERQYEREFTSTSFLMSKIADLETEIAVKNRTIESLEDAKTITQHALDLCREEFRKYRQANPDQEEQFRQVAREVAQRGLGPYKPLIPRGEEEQTEDRYRRGLGQ